MCDVVHWYKKDKIQNYNPDNAIVRYISGTYITALLWCIYGVIVLRDSDSFELAGTVVIITAMAGGGATVLSAHKTTSMAYTFILLVPSSLCLLYQDQSYRQFLGGLGLIYAAVMIVGAKNAAQFTAQAIKLKNENALLLDHMEDVVEERTRQIFSLSNIDPLSNLLNRTAFLKHLDKALLKAENKKNILSVLFIDLDGFKEVNDTVGHEMGDKLLAKTAERLQSYNDEQLLCRWGGDEFLICIENTEKSAVFKIAKELITIISQPYFLEGNQLSIGATIGMTFYPEHANSAGQLIQLADTAMYHQKQRNPGQPKLFSEEISSKLLRVQSLKEGLNNAIEQGQLRLHFQPIMCSSTQKIYACEALLRWQRDDESISPVEFIPIAEKYGLIRKIGTWVLHEACTQAAKWPQDCAVNIAINVSVIQLQASDFIKIVDAALASSGLSPKRLNIEVTESVFATDKCILLRQFKALQLRGIKLSIDDFGTEYSSLSVIQNLAVNTIKIDRSFVQQLESNGLAIIKAVMQIAIALNYKVVAEGVETEEQANQLTRLGVNFLQGYFYAKPICSSSIVEFIENWEPCNEVKNIRGI